jgi:hypothetical protein
MNGAVHKKVNIPQAVHKILQGVRKTTQ